MPKLVQYDECPVCSSKNLLFKTTQQGVIITCKTCAAYWPATMGMTEAKEYVVKENISTYVKLLVERKIREADVTGGEKTPWGSSKHVKDLKKRIEDATWWRNKQPKGSESRANYSRLITKLKNELKSAIKISEKKKTKKNDK